jgi:hypothetical protein
MTDARSSVPTIDPADAIERMEALLSKIDARVARLERKHDSLDRSVLRDRRQRRSAA